MAATLPVVPSGMSDRDFPLESSTFTHHDGHEGNCRHFDQSACDCSVSSLLEEIRQCATEIQSSLSSYDALAVQESGNLIPADGYSKGNSAVIAKLRFILGYSRLLASNARRVTDKLIAGEVLSQ